MQIDFYFCVLIFIILFSSLVFIEHHSVYICHLINYKITRGMSYDMRCMPKVNKKHSVWMNSHIKPNHYGKCLELM